MTHMSDLGSSRAEWNAAWWQKAHRAACQCRSKECKSSKYPVTFLHDHYEHHTCTVLSGYLFKLCFVFLCVNILYLQEHSILSVKVKPLELWSEWNRLWVMFFPLDCDHWESSEPAGAWTAEAAEFGNAHRSAVPS